MPIQAKAEAFHRLHAPGTMLFLPNAWDAGSARFIESLGAKAVATSSAALAWAHGYPDGETLPRDVLVGSVQEITRSVGVPVSADAERGYGADPSAVADTVSRLVGAGAAGINIEDGTAPARELAARIEAARTASAREGVQLFVNARTDLWFSPTDSPEARVAETIARGRLYAEAGADGFFVPRLVGIEAIRAVADAVPLPLSLMAVAEMPPAPLLREAGVRRVSLGVMTLLKALGSLRGPLDAFLRAGELGPMFQDARSFAEIDGLFT